MKNKILKKLLTPILSALALVCLLVAALFTSLGSTTHVFATTTTTTTPSEATFTVVDGKSSSNKSENYDKIGDGDIETKYCIPIAQKPYVVFKASHEVALKRYVFYTGNDTASIADRNPKSWTLYGSNDYDESNKDGDWSEVHSVTDDTTMSAVNHFPYAFSFVNDTAYRYYKFEFSACGSQTASFQLAEIDLTGTLIPMTETDQHDVFSVVAGYKHSIADCNYPNLFDGNKNTSYNILLQYKPYITFSTKAKYVLKGYSFTLAEAKYRPTSWKIEGSQQKDSDYTTLATVDDTTMTAGYTKYSFSLDNSTYYAYYKFSFIGVVQNEETRFKLAEIDLQYGVVCEHTWSENDYFEGFDATCSAVGIRKYRVCTSCREAYQYVGDDNQKYVCSKSEYSSKIIIPKLEHAYGNLLAAKPKTCTTVGMTARYQCANCLSLFDQSKVIKTVSELSIPSSHEYRDWTNAVTANCTESGNLKHRKCTVCNGYEYVDNEGNTLTCAESEYSTTIYLPSPGHDYGTTVEAKAVNCTQSGNLEYRQCSRCKIYEYVDSVGTKTCAENEYDTKIKINIDPTAHNFDEWTNAVDPTCTQVGNLKHRKCSLCKIYEYVDTTGTKTCAESEYDAKIKIDIDPTAHNFGEWTNAVDPSCENGGNLKHRQCLLCNIYEYVDERETKTCPSVEFEEKILIAALNHDFPAMNDGLSAICLADGYHPYSICTRCAKYKYTDGEETLICNATEYDAEVKISASGHNFPNDGVYNANDESKHWQACRNANCTETRGESEHSFTSACDRSCNGDCGYLKTEEDVADAHVYGDYHITYNLSTGIQKHVRVCQNDADDNSKCYHEDSEQCVWAEGWYLGWQAGDFGYYHTEECTICGFANNTRKVQCEPEMRNNGDGTHCEWCNIGDHKMLDSSDGKHNYRSTYVTDSEGDYHDGYCSTCGAWKGDPEACAGDKWKSDASKHWKECTRCDHKLDEREHLPVLIFDEEDHWYVCSVCNVRVSDYVDHEFESPSSTTCSQEGCGYVRFFDLKIEINGYEIDELISGLSLSATSANEDVTVEIEQLRVFNDEFDEIFTEDKSPLKEKYAKFRPHAWYYLSVYFDCGTAYPYDGFSIDDLDLPQGVVIADYDWWTATRKDGSKFVQVFVGLSLSPMGGVSQVKKIPTLNATVSGFALDSQVGDVNLSVDDEHVTVENLTLYRIDDKAMTSTDVITDEKLITIYFDLIAEDGYTFYGFTTNDITVANDVGTVYYTSVSSGGCRLSASLDMTSFIKEHECSYDKFVKPDYDDENQDPESKHLAYCSICGDEKYVEHEFNGLLDQYCDHCNYEREIIVDEVFINLIGYTIDGRITEISANMIANDYGLSVYSDFFVILTEDGKTVKSNSARFLPSVQYYLVVMLCADVELTLPTPLTGNVYVNGIETEIAFVEYGYSDGETECAYFLKLTPLVGKSSQKKATGIELSATGFEIGSAVGAVEIEDIEHPAINAEKTNYAFWCDEDTLLTPSNVFTVGHDYVVTVSLALNDGYHALGMSEGDVTFGDYKRVGVIYTGENDSQDGYYRYVVYSFLINFDMGEEHEHSYTGDEKYIAIAEGHYPVCECGAVGDLIDHVYTKDPLICDLCSYKRTITVEELSISLDRYEVGATYSVFNLNIDQNTFMVVSCELYEDFDYDNVNLRISPAEFVESGKKYTLALIVGLNPNGHKWGELTLDKISLKGVGESDVSPTMIIDTSFGDMDCKVLLLDLPVLEGMHLHGGEYSKGIPSTCTAIGTKAHTTCTICGKYFDDDGNEITDLSLPLDHTTHKYGDWTNAVTANCTEGGNLKHRKCTVCGGYEYVDASGATKTCSESEYDAIIKLSALGHDFGEWIDEILATTIKEGVKAHKDCSICGKHFGEDGDEIADLTIEKIEEKVKENCKSSLGTSGIALATATFAAILLKRKSSNRDEE